MTKRDSIPDQEVSHLHQGEIEGLCHLTVAEQAPILDQDLHLHFDDDRFRHVAVLRILGRDLHVDDDLCHKVVMQVFRLVFILDQGVLPHVGGTLDRSHRRLLVTAQGEVGDFILGQERLLLVGGRGEMEVQ